MKAQKAQNKAILGSENNTRDILTPDPKLYCRATVTKQHGTDTRADAKTRGNKIEDTEATIAYSCVNFDKDINIYTYVYIHVDIGMYVYTHAHTHSGGKASSINIAEKKYGKEQN